MLGRICEQEKRGLRVIQEQENLGGLQVLRVSIPQPVRDWKLKRAAKLLYRAGVRRVLVPSGFDRWPILTEGGLARVETEDFCRAIAATLALAALDAWGIAAATATVALRGERVTRAMRLAALALCDRVRNVVIAAPQGGGGLQAELRREYGVPALEERLGRDPDVALHFSEVRGGGPTFRLYGPGPELCGFDCVPRGETLPKACERLPLLAALWETGRLDPEDGFYLTLDRPGQTTYNTG